MPPPFFFLESYGRPVPISHRREICKLCGDGKGVVRISVPYVFRYLVAELLAMNISVTMDIV